MGEKKRFECVFVEDDFGGTFRRLKDNETNMTYMTCDVADLLNFQNTQIKILNEENEQLRENLHNCRFNKNIIREKLKLWQEVHKEYNIYSIKDFEELLNEQDRKIRQLEKSIEQREEQISIIKKHCKTYLTEEQYKTIKEALSVT